MKAFSLSGCLKAVVAALGFVFLLGIAVSTLERDRSGDSTQTPAVTTQLTPEQQQAQEAARRRRECLDWCYTTTTDELSGKPIHTAYVFSENTFRFQFPYQGEQRAQLILRKHPRFGHDAILRIERGQIPCTIGCTTTVRFGDGQPRRWDMNGPKDNDPTVVFFKRSGEFERAAHNAREIAIEFTVFQQGANIAIFRPTKDLSWPQ